MRYPESLGVITCRCVMEERKAILFVSHAGGDWQMYCHWKNHDFSSPETLQKQLVLVHVEHLLAQDRTIEEVADLAIDVGAERETVGGEWLRYEDRDED
ncbi:MAG: hypothetical protein ABL931_02810 [Usitatibacteraceae bacterium]